MGLDAVALAVALDGGRLGLGLLLCAVVQEL